MNEALAARRWHRSCVACSYALIQVFTPSENYGLKRIFMPKPSTPTNTASTSNPHCESVGIEDPCTTAGISVEVSVSLNMYGDATESDCVY